MPDFFTLLMAIIQSRGQVVLEGDGYTFTDTGGDGNIVIEEDDT